MLGKIFKTIKQIFILDFCQIFVIIKVLVLTFIIMTRQQIKERKEKMIKLRQQDFSLEAIGSIFGITKQGVYCILRNTHKPIELKKIFESIKKRDNYSCVRCNKKSDSLIIHHIDTNPGNNKLKNLITLCHKCHARIHSNILDKIIYEQENKETKTKRA